MATSANGFIARTNDKTDWSSVELDAYMSKVKETGNLVVGRKTYELMLNDPSPDADMEKVGNPLVVVVTNSKKYKDNDSTKFVSSAKESLAFLQSKNFTHVMVAGGSKLIASFLTEGLVDELFLDIEPLLFGQGIPLLIPTELELNLQLLDTKILGKNSVQLHYKVIY